MVRERVKGRFAIVALLAALALGGVGALIASVGVALGDDSAGCPASGPASPPQSPPASPPDCPSASPPVSPPLSPPLSPPVPAPTNLRYTGPTVLANGLPVSLSARLTGPGGSPIGGEPIVLTLGVGGGAQSCPATTSPAGVGTCALSAVAQPLGPGTAFANFAGDNTHFPSQTSAPVLVFAYTSKGTFAIGNVAAGAPTVGRSVLFWGDTWSSSNAMSGGSAPKSMKGFVTRTSAPACGASWTSDPGDTGLEPATVPTYMAVIVTSRVAKSGSKISGNTVHIVVVHTSAYGPTPTKPGRGTIVGVVC